MSTYTAQAGDSISKIALNILGNMSLWPRLAAVNNIASPYVIYPGQILQLPDLGSAPMPVPAGSSMPVPASSGGLMQWIMANKLMIGGGLALLGVIYLAMGSRKIKRIGKKRHVRAG